MTGSISGALTGRTVLITGASAGLGRHFAQLCAAQGASLALLARRGDLLDHVAADLRSETGAEIATAVADVADEAAVEAGVASFVERFGRIDVVVNNAGGAPINRAVTVPNDEWQTVIGSNLSGTFFVSRAVARHAIEAATPLSIVNIASVLGLRVMAQTASYASAKAAVVQLTKQLALEWARHGIRVNALCPGYFPSDAAEFSREGAVEAMAARVPLRRLGTLDELDGPLLLLASDLGSYLTGTVLTVDGGLSVSGL